MCLACEVYGNIHISQPAAPRRLPDENAAPEAGADPTPPTSDCPPAQTAGTSEACKKATSES